MWVDTIQSLIMVSGGITLFIYGLAQVGGLGEAMNNLDAAGLNNFLELVNFFSIKLYNLLNFKLENL